MRILPVSICLSLFLSHFAYAATFLQFDSQPGDYIGGGIKQTLTPNDGTFTLSGNTASNIVTVHFQSSTWWDLNFAAPSGQIIQQGAYENATRSPFQSPTEPGLDVSGDGRGCNTLTGRFVVLEAAYSSTNVLERFAADFEQHCEGGGSALFGSIRYNATVGFPAKVAVHVNGSHNPITVKTQDVVQVNYTLETGDDAGQLAEQWLGVVGTYGNHWYNGKTWVRAIIPRPAGNNSIETINKTFRFRFRNPGIYVFMIALDRQIDGKLDTEAVDQVVVTVQQGESVIPLLRNLNTTQ